MLCSHGRGAGVRRQRHRLAWRDSRIVRCRRWTWCTNWVNKKFNTEGTESTERDFAAALHRREVSPLRGPARKYCAPEKIGATPVEMTADSVGARASRQKERATALGMTILGNGAWRKGERADTMRGTYEPAQTKSASAG